MAEVTPVIIKVFKIFHRVSIKVASLYTVNTEISFYKQWHIVIADALS